MPKGINKYNYVINTKIEQEIYQEFKSLIGEKSISTTVRNLIKDYIEFEKATKEERMKILHSRMSALIKSL